MVTEIDFQILDWVAEHLRCGFLDAVCPVLTALGEYGAVWILLTLALLLFPKTRKAGLASAIALILDLILCNLLLKPLVARPRPFAVRPEIELLIKAPTDFSFPSGHTAAAFACSSALLFSKNKGWIPAMILAALIAFTRIYLYVHYPSDVLGGVLVGFFCGFFGVFLAKKLPVFRENREK